MSDLVKFEAEVDVATTVEQLSPPLQNLFNFLVLIADVKYRQYCADQGLSSPQTHSGSQK